MSLISIFLVFVIAENTQKGLVSAKRMSQAMTLIPQLYQVKGQGESNDVKELDVELKMKGGRQEVDYAIEIGSYTLLCMCLVCLTLSQKFDD